VPVVREQASVIGIFGDVEACASEAPSPPGASATPAPRGLSARLSSARFSTRLPRKRQPLISCAHDIAFLHVRCDDPGVTGTVFKSSAFMDRQSLISVRAFILCLHGVNVPVSSIAADVARYRVNTESERLHRTTRRCRVRQLTAQRNLRAAVRSRDRACS
jgi:hypothetical protein